MKVDEDILKKDLLQLLREMELFDYYRGGKKLHLTNFLLRVQSLRKDSTQMNVTFTSLVSVIM